MSCLLVGAVAMTLSGSDFRLEWTHSVEKTGWREDWRIEGATLRLTGAAVKGSGAGMDPGPGAVLHDGWWVWSPDLPPQESLHLAASGATGAGWRLCDGAECQVIGAMAGQAVTIRPCP